MVGDNRELTSAPRTALAGLTHSTILPRFLLEITSLASSLPTGRTVGRSVWLSGGHTIKASEREKHWGLVALLVNQCQQKRR